jgi:uncharacterized membrane protein
MPVKNEGALDRGARALIGGGLLACSIRRLGVASGRPLGILSAVIGAGLLVTAATTGCCPLYRALGIDTSTQSTGDPA